MDIIRILIFVVLIAIVASLGSALFHLSSSKSNNADNSRKMVRALTVRIVLSLALFFLIMLAWWFGLITPHNYPQ